MFVHSKWKVLWKCSCHLQKSCCYIGSFIQYASLQSWTLKVQPYWKLVACLRNCDLDIKSYDPIKNVDGNKLFVEVFHNQSIKNSEKHDFNVVADELQSCVSLTNNLTINQVVKVLTPPAFDFDIHLEGDSSLSISNIESIAVLAHVQHGDIKLNNIKAQNVKSSAINGRIISTKILQGNVTLKAKSIEADKIQSPEANIVASDGKLSLKDVYTEKFFAKNETGDITIQSVHGDSEIKTNNGNIAIGTLEGNLRAFTNHGNVNVHIAAPEQVYISTDTGNISISTPEDVKVTMDLESADIISKTFQMKMHKPKVSDSGHCNEDGPLIQAVAKEGSIEFGHSSWMQRIIQFRKRFMAS